MKKWSWRATAYLTLVLLFMYLPILVVVLFSFNASTARVPTVFTGFSLDAYLELFSGQGGYGDALKTSVEIALYSVTLSTVLGTLGAIGLTRRKAAKTFGQKALAAGRGFLEDLSALPMMIPEIILGVAFMALFSRMGIPSGKMTLTLAHTTFCVPYVYLIVKSRLATMDESLVLAARDLGATPMRAIMTVTLPLIRPGVVSGALLALAMSLDDFVISFFVNGPETTTLPIKIYSSVKYGVSTQVNALCTLMLVAVFSLVAVSQFMLRRKKSAREEQA